MPYSHGVLTVRDNDTYTWKVFGKNEAIEDERLQQQAGPDPGSHELFIAMLGARDWELVQVDRGGVGWEFWFKRATS